MMRRPKKSSSHDHPAPSRKPALSASAAGRGAFPAWIVADESGVAFPARTVVTPRVRDALVLRTVEKAKPSSPRDSRNARSAR